MTTSRRGFLGSLLALPVVARLWPAEVPDPRIAVIRELLDTLWGYQIAIETYEGGRITRPFKITDRYK